MARMTGFVFQDSYIEKVKRLTDQELGRLVRALAVYHATGEEQELAGREIVAYDFIRDDIDKADRAYQAKCNNMRRQDTVDASRPQLETIGGNCEQNKKRNKNENCLNNNNNARVEETPFGPVTIDPLIVKIQTELNGLTDTHYQRLEDYRQTLGDALVGYAIDAAVGNGVRNWAYVEAILRGYEKDGIKSVGEAKSMDEKRRKRPKEDNNSRTLNAQRFSQRDYTEDELRGTSDNDILRAIEANRREGTA